MVFNEPGTSHFNDAVTIAAVLEERGHKITFLLPHTPVFRRDQQRGKHMDKFHVVQLSEDCAPVKENRSDTVKMAQDAHVKSGEDC